MITESDENTLNSVGSQMTWIVRRYQIYVNYSSIVTSVLNHSTLEFRDFSKRSPAVLSLCSIDVFLNADSESPHMT